ncbi:MULTISPECIES: G5 domain-containing protein [unclassified Granulicatella]|uniref:G5 domain-containing protein n=1 Tax=unclassified Granulicatella TaxID=2630493 RepID=UPI0010740FBC|nr:MULTISPECIES: G5 domain-containing protein [unclassified Granulicatella]MBF0780522.1 G5 domain-containing protein [Granulicatella sp. 19428wC4_WM01]TFU95336.1 hypothetical protein E4T68_05380 [Granulicatella sp. WM01]
MKKNSTNLRQVKGGNVVKQNDIASIFTYELLNAENIRCDELNGQEAEVILVSHLDDGSTNIAYRQHITVENGSVTFTITQRLEPRVYIVEVKCGGYIFASNNRTTLKVNPSGFEESVVEIKEEYLAYDTRYINDSTIPVDVEVVEQEGEDGINRVTVINGVRTSSEIIKDPVTKVIRVRVKEHIAYANIVKKAPFYEPIEQTEILRVEENEPVSVSWEYFGTVEAGKYEVTIEIRKLTDKVTNISFGFEELGKMHKVLDISSQTMTYSFVVDLEATVTLMHDIRFDHDIALESFNARQIEVTDLSTTDYGQNSIGTAQTRTQDIELLVTNYEWKTRE